MDRFLAGVERRAFRMAEVVTGDREAALDIVQDAMYKLVQRYGQRRQDDWGPLFHRIMQNRIVDWHRRIKLRKRWIVWLGRDENGSDPIDQLADNTAPGPARQAGSQRALVDLQAAIQVLPVRQRQAFMLRAWEGLDVSATAKAMGCSAGSVKTHYSRALRALRHCLGDHWP